MKIEASSDVEKASIFLIRMYRGLASAALVAFIATSAARAFLTA